MDQRVSSVMLVFEAYEDLELDAGKLKEFGCEGIRGQVRRVAANSILRQTSCERLYLVLGPEFDTNFSDGRTVFDRLKTPDIVSAVIRYEDGGEERVYAPWCGSGGHYGNRYQSSYVAPDGSFRLLIDSGQTAEAFFGISDGRD